MIALLVALDVAVMVLVIAWGLRFADDEPFSDGGVGGGGQ